MYHGFENYQLDIPETSQAASFGTQFLDGHTILNLHEFASNIGQLSKVFTGKLERKFLWWFLNLKLLYSLEFGMSSQTVCSRKSLVCLFVFLWSCHLRWSSSFHRSERRISQQWPTVDISSLTFCWNFESKWIRPKLDWNAKIEFSEIWTLNLNLGFFRGGYYKPPFKTHLLYSFFSPGVLNKSMLKMKNIRWAQFVRPLPSFTPPSLTSVPSPFGATNF